MNKLFKCSIAISIFYMAVFGEILPITTEVFQEVPIDEVGKIAQDKWMLSSIKMEPVQKNEVKYLIKFSGTKNDTLPLAERFSYQDLKSIHVFDFYNCYSVGEIDGIAIRHSPVSGIDKKMYRSKNSYVLRVVFTCDAEAKTQINPVDSTLIISFSTAPKIAAAAKASLASSSNKSSSTSFINFPKKALYGIGFAAVAGAVSSYYIGHSSGKTQGMDEVNSGIPKLPALPTKEEAFPADTYK